MLVTATKEEVKMTMQEEAKVFLQKMYLIEQLMRSKKIAFPLLSSQHLE